MAAAVVYDAAGSGGTLFEGKKFWVAQRVPTRSRWLGLILANGGQIVALEKLADILIADHARKDAAPGSYSWKWIDESVKNGRLEDLEPYRAGKIAGTPRPVGSTQPIRNTRTPFTPADDRALAMWVTKAERQGLSTKGNDLYQQLERINPRHTFQSWRDRWVKYLQFQPRPEVLSSPTASGPVPERPSASRTIVLSTGSTLRPAASQVTNSVPKSLPPSEGNPFTEDEGKTLMDIYDDIMNIDEERQIAAWVTFAEANPRHTAQEWFDFWKYKIKPLRNSVHRKSINRKPRVLASQNEQEESLQVLDRNAKDMPIQPVVSEQSPMPQESSGPLPTEVERFEHTLAEFAEGQGLEVHLQPAVSGKEIRLFDLWTLVFKPGFNSSPDNELARKWDQIASKLGFDKSREPDAANELRYLYDWVLADFAELRSQYRTFLKGILNDGRDLTEEQALDFEYLTPAGYEEEDEMVMQKLQEEDDDESETLEIPSSPPQRIWPSFAKRDRLDTASLGNENTSPRQPDVTSHKRRRVDKGKQKLLEIPTTPEDLLKFDGQVHERSPVKSLIRVQEEESETSEEEEESLFIKPVKRKIFSKTTLQATKTIQFEPETQDFHFSQAFEEEIVTQTPQHIREDLVAPGESVLAVAGSLHEDSSTQSQTDSQREALEVQELVDHYISLGYAEEIVQEAMMATTLETGDVTLVMEAIMQGHGIPDNIEGVWTAEDDHAVRLNEDSKEYVRVLLKHKEARCVKRRQLLRQTEVLNEQ